MGERGMESMAEEIRRSAKELFDAGKIELLVGFRKGSVGYRAKPAFISSAEETQELVWDATCSNNIAVYLPSLFPKAPVRTGTGTPAGAGQNTARKGSDSAGGVRRIGFVVKGCDLRSLIALVRENQAKRENVVLIGVPCRGMIDARKLDAAVGGARAFLHTLPPRAALGASAHETACAHGAADQTAYAHGAGRVEAEITSLADGTQAVIATLSDGQSISFPREALLQDACLVCRHPMPEGVDILIAGSAREAGDGADAIVREFEKLAATERWRRFSGEISRCIRCYACRQACPTCYCTECFADINSPAWIGVSNELSDAMIFHLIRIFHQAGRCVECDACVRACPMHIDLRTYTKKIAADVRDLFGYAPGFDPAAIAPLCTFKEDDRQGFLTEPRKGAPAQGALAVSRKTSAARGITGYG